MEINFKSSERYTIRFPSETWRIMITLFYLSRKNLHRNLFMDLWLRNTIFSFLKASINPVATLFSSIPFLAQIKNEWGKAHTYFIVVWACHTSLRVLHLAVVSLRLREDAGGGCVPLQLINTLIRWDAKKDRSTIEISCRSTGKRNAKESKVAET